MGQVRIHKVVPRSQKSSHSPMCKGGCCPRRQARSEPVRGPGTGSALIPRLCPVPSVSLRKRFAPRALRWDKFRILKVSHGVAGVLTGGNRGNREMPRLQISVALRYLLFDAFINSIGSRIAQLSPVPSVSLRNRFSPRGLRWDNFRILKVSHGVAGVLT